MPNTPTRIPLARKWDQAQSAGVSLERLVNWYAEPTEDGAFALYPTFGMSVLDDLADVPGTGPIRGMCPIYSATYGWILIVVGFSKVYRFEPGGPTLTEIGSIHNASTGVFMASNNTQVGIVDPFTTGAYYTDGVTVAAISGSAGKYFVGITSQDGYGILAESGSQAWWATNVDDMSTIGGTSFTSADASPGLNVGCQSVNREVWIHKTDATEIYQNVGTSPFPFSRVQVIERGALQQGLIGKHGAPLWVGDDGVAYQADGYTPRPISTPAITAAFRSIGFGSDCYQGTYSEAGHVFWMLRTVYHAFFYDLTTGLWHQRTSVVSGSEAIWRGRCIAETPQSTLPPAVYVGSNADGKIFSAEFSSSMRGVEGSNNLTREVITPPIVAPGDRRAIMSELFLDADYCATGSILLSWSDDDGTTWATEQSRALQGSGANPLRLKWTRLGSFRRRHLRIRCTSTVAGTNPILRGLYARMSVGD